MEVSKRRRNDLNSIIENLGDDYHKLNKVHSLHHHDRDDDDSYSGELADGCFDDGNVRMSGSD